MQRFPLASLATIERSVSFNAVQVSHASHVPGLTASKSMEYTTLPFHRAQTKIPNIPSPQVIGNSNNGSLCSGTSRPNSAASLSERQALTESISPLWMVFNALGVSIKENMQTAGDVMMEILGADENMSQSDAEGYGEAGSTCEDGLDLEIGG